MRDASSGFQDRKYRRLFARIKKGSNRARNSHPTKQNMKTTLEKLQAHRAAITDLAAKPLAYKAEIQTRIAKAKEDHPGNLDRNIENRVELPILIQLLAEHEHNSDGEHAARAGDGYVTKCKLELTSLLSALVEEKTAALPGFLAKVASSVADFSTKIFTSKSEAEAMNARQAREIEEEKAAGVAEDIRQAKVAIRMFELEPSLAAFNAAEGAVQRLTI